MRQLIRRIASLLKHHRLFIIGFLVLVVSIFIYFKMPVWRWASEVIFITGLALWLFWILPKQQFTTTLEVKSAEDWDYLKGWVRINYHDRKGLSRHRVCRISRDEKVTRRAVLGTKSQGIIQMDFDTREELGVKIGNKYEFAIQPLARWQLSEWQQHLWNHPDTGVRMGYRVGLISFLLGFLISRLLDFVWTWLF